MSLGKELVKLCRERKYGDAIAKLYSEDVVTVEPCDECLKGIHAVQEKNDWWVENFEIHTNEIQGPFPHHDRFAVAFRTDVTHRPSQKRIALDEIGVYTVQDGKIIRAEFFHDDGE